VQAQSLESTLAKVPAITLGFWLVKIASTTLGETAGDAASMSLHLGYLTATGLFAAVFAALVLAQIRASGFRPALYWSTIVATTTVGTTLADFADRSLGIGYAGGSSLLLALLAGSLLLWRRSTGSIAVGSVHGGKAEVFYWVTIMLSQTLGTALGDWTADTAGLGYQGGALLFGSALAALALLYWRSAVSRTALFWAAFILTRPLGAVLGDFLDKPVASGGLELSRFGASAALIACMVLALRLMPQRAAATAH
jgi:uncharacterized membrane-anchored protein